MTEMTARVRNKLQDGVINWQERRYRNSDFRQQQADIHRSRMTCSASLPSFHQTQDWTGGIPVCERKPAIEETRPQRKIVSSEGIRWDAALAALIVIGVILAAILVADLASVGMGSRTIQKLHTSIEEQQNKNERKKAEIQLSESNTSVRTEAVKLNLISSNGARTLRLTAPVNAQLTISTAEHAAENADLEGRMTSNAGD
jgi:cell division protein FtsL